MRMIGRWAGVAVAGLLLLAACGGTAPQAKATAKPTPHGTANVLYAASLTNLFEKKVAPSFEKATGDGYEGYGAGSSAVANSIKGKVKQGDVFVSASPDVNTTLEGDSNGNWVTWYVTFASAPLVIAYNPKSSFAKDLKAKPWYQAIAEPGIKLGRTDPVLDPKGKLTVQALTEAEQTYGQPGFAAKIEAAAQVFPEEDLVGRLEAGQLDAGFFYSNEAKDQSLPTVSLGKVKLAATYTVTVLQNAPNQAAGVDFVTYLLGAKGKAMLEADGITVGPYKLSGTRSDVPKPIRSLLPV